MGKLCKGWNRGIVSGFRSLLAAALAVGLSAVVTEPNAEAANGNGAGNTQGVGHAAPPASLFSEAPVPVAPGPFGRAAVAANLDISGLARGARSLSLGLPGGTEIELTLSFLERRGKGELAWFGKVADEPDSEVVLTLKRGFVVGRVAIGEIVYEVRPGEGRQLMGRANRFLSRP